jgi:hypothetical protein
MSSRVRGYLAQLTPQELDELLASCVPVEVLAVFITRLIRGLSPSTLENALAEQVKANPCMRPRLLGLPCNRYNGHPGRCQARDPQLR